MRSANLDHQYSIILGSSYPRDSAPIAGLSAGPLTFEKHHDTLHLGRAGSQSVNGFHQLCSNGYQQTRRTSSLHFELPVPSHPTMLAPAVVDFIEIFDGVGSFIFGMVNSLTSLVYSNEISVERGDDQKPTFHIQTCQEILTAKSHFPTKADASVLYAGSILREKPDMLRGMITTIANDVTASVIYADSDALARYLVGEAMKIPHAPYISASGSLMDSMIRPSVINNQLYLVPVPSAPSVCLGTQSSERCQKKVRLRAVVRANAQNLNGEGFSRAVMTIERFSSHRVLGDVIVTEVPLGTLWAYVRWSTDKVPQVRHDANRLPECQLNTMTDALTDLVELFEARGAFILAHHQGHPCPAFEVVTARDIRDSGRSFARRHHNTVLLAMDDLYDNEYQLTRTIRTIANDSNITAVYAESMQLADHLASEATKMHEARLERESGLGDVKNT
ncbi:hypothetical protein EV702DRAFT_1043822 [Suillus placidus]|uniref:Uncharacterized protein n=1 Tax=Suillus placidus TaxID=48579 RepID=A0A9P7A085_9AGAM|nr:hypothetical protein EV702DRAFT_1043822 [Suillus placidus]